MYTQTYKLITLLCAQQNSSSITTERKVKDVIGLLLVTHGNFGAELLRSAELIVGPFEQAEALTLQHGDDVQVLRKNVAERICALDQGEGVLVLIDLFGGSPSNITAANMRETDFQCLTGVNMAMLVEALEFREECDLVELKERCLEAGRAGIRDLREAFQARKMKA
ncbi:PTS sugar transporter subunit IIA [Paenibacillus senegalensis]|uniref:PTS sugar transporter subunit IIA n=1 Tax=Paenibacillus senegalensis TaxID=1465766 RepID=UPI001B307E23|nr:PTS mannose transporter subunit IIAB [Paenibacillus senegalensis]